MLRSWVITTTMRRDMQRINALLLEQGQQRAYAEWLYWNTAEAIRAAAGAKGDVLAIIDVRRRRWSAGYPAIAFRIPGA